MIENNMRRALTAANGDFMIFLEKPVSLVFLLEALLWLIASVSLQIRRRRNSVEIGEER
jgi:putative tricarboxylic transport membrane protein